MSLFQWFIHEDSSYSFLDNILKDEFDDLEIIKCYAQKINDKFVLLEEKNISGLKKIMNIQEGENRSFSIHIKIINHLLKKFSDLKLNLISEQRREVIKLKSELKKLKLNLKKQVLIIMSDESRIDWSELKFLISSEVSIFYSIRSDETDLKDATSHLKSLLYPNTPKFLSVEEVILLNKNLLSHQEGGGGRVSNMASLDSAVNRPRASSLDGYLYGSIFSKAAALLFSLVENQPFIDGNTRTSVYATIEFLRLNGIIVHDNKKLFSIAKSLANNKTSIPVLGRYIRSLAA